MVVSDLSSVEKTPLSRLSGIVTGARMDLVRRRGRFVQYIPPFIIGLVYFLYCVPFIKNNAFQLIMTLSMVAGGIFWFRLLRFITTRTFIAFFTVIAWISPLFSVSTKSFPLSLPSLVALGFIVSDSAHIIGLLLTPIPLYYSLKFLRKPLFPYFLTAIISVSFVGLISPFSLLNLFILSLIFGFSEVMLGEGRLKFVRLITITLCGIFLTSFWYHPGFVLSLLNTQSWLSTIASLSALAPLLFFVIPVASIVSFLIFDRKPQLQPLFLSLAITIVYGLIHFSESTLGTRVAVPFRFLPEYALGTSFLLGVVIVNSAYLLTVFVLKKSAGNYRWLPLLPYILSSFFLGFILISIIINLADFISTVQSINLLTIQGATTVADNKVNWISQSGTLLSHILGFIITAVTALWLYNLYKLFTINQPVAKS